MIEAAIFDMDGVLVDSEQYWQRYLDDVILPEATDSDVLAEDVKGRNVHDIYAYLEERSNPVVSEEEFVHRYWEMAEEIYRRRVNLLGGCHRMLDGLAANGVKLAIASSSPIDWIQMVLSRFRLVELFDAVVSADESNVEGKPSPDVYVHTVERLATDASRCVAVEDSLSGIRAAAGADILCIGFSITGGNVEELEHANYVAETPVDLRQKLLALAS